MMYGDFDREKFQSLLGKLLENKEFRIALEGELSDCDSDVVNTLIREEHVESMDTDEWYDLAFDLFRNNAGTVISLGWNGDFPGMSGAVYVSELAGIYIVTSSDYDDRGPFESLDDALENCECFDGVTAKPELDSAVLTPARLKNIAARLVDWENGGEIWINSTRYVASGDKLVLSDSSEES